MTKRNKIAICIGILGIIFFFGSGWLLSNDKYWASKTMILGAFLMLAFPIILNLEDL